MPFLATFRKPAVGPVERKRRPGLLRRAGGLERRPKLTVNCRNYLEFVGMLAALFGVDEK